MALDLAGANLLGTLFELFIFGIYCTVSLDHIKILYKRRSCSLAFGFVAGTTLALFILIAMHTILDTIRLFNAFIDTMAIPYGALKHFAIYKTNISVTRTAITCITVIVSDIFLVYRVFVIWNFSYFIALAPFLLLLADIGLTALVMVSLEQTTNDQAFAVTLIGTRAKYFFLVTLAENLLCTLLIAGKIWYMKRLSGPYRVHTDGTNILSRVMTIILESAAIYSVFLIALIVCNVTGNAGYFTINNMLGPIVGIVFSTILVRSSANENGTTKGPRSPYSTMNFHRSGIPTSHLRTQPSQDTTTLDGVQVHLESISHIDSEGDAMRGAKHHDKPSSTFGLDSV